jgi:hypothetical protein
MLLSPLFTANGTTSLKQFLAFFFPIFTVLALWFDAVSFQENYFDGKPITTILAILYFTLFFFSAQTYLRKLMFCMVFLSYVGELIFCTILEMYVYKNPAIPLYVPFGHAIVYASGFVLAETDFFTKHKALLQKLFFVSFCFLFLVVGIFLHDVFTLCFGFLFFILLKRKKWDILYYSIALCVIFIELVGTYFKCWTWNANTFGRIPTVNPPMGAVFFYAGGDVILAKIVHYWRENKN